MTVLLEYIGLLYTEMSSQALYGDLVLKLILMDTYRSGVPCHD